MVAIAEMLADFRQRPGDRTGDIPDESFHVGSYTTRLIRTQADDPDDENDPTYPSQVDGKSARLPFRFLRLEHLIGDSDPARLLVIDRDEDLFLMSPFGWVPRLVDLEVSVHNGFFVAIFVPKLEVEISESGGIEAGDSGEVTIVKHGSANGQTFTAWFDHMAAGTATEGMEAIAELMPGEKKWRIHNLGCET